MIISTEKLEEISKLLSIGKHYEFDSICYFESKGNKFIFSSRIISVSIEKEISIDNIRECLSIYNFHYIQSAIRHCQIMGKEFNIENYESVLFTFV